MTSITTRAGKGSPLTNTEIDANFTGLNTGKVEGAGTVVDNRVVRFDTTTGLAIQQSLVSISDTGDVTGVVGLTATGAIAGNTVTSGGSAVLTAITSGNVTTALGYTPTSVTGLTGTQTVAAFKTGLSLTVGTNVQAFSANLTTFSGITPSANVQTLLGAATFAAFKTSLALTIGTDVQAYDAELAALASVTSAADKVPYFSGSGTATTTDLTSVARTLINQTTQALMRTTGLGLTANGSSLVTATDYTAMKVLLALTPGTDVETMGEYSAQNAQTGTTYTLVLTDKGKLLTLNNASAITLTIPLNSSVAFPVKSRIDLAQLGAGQVSIAATGGVTIRSSGSKLKITGQYSGASLTKIATDEWLLVGDIAT